MIIPIRCFTCGKVIADKYETYLEKILEYKKDIEKKEKESGSESLQENKILGVNYIQRKKDGKLNNFETPEFKALRDLEIERYCCRRHFLTHTDLVEEI